MIIVSVIYKKIILTIQEDLQIFENEKEKLKKATIQLDFNLLTEREKEVAELLLSNMKNRNIAKKLYISENTLKKHAKSIYHKLGVKNKRELKKLLNESFLVQK